MSHTQQMNFISRVKKMFPTNFKNSKILEIGSLNINGTIRIFFENCDYTGVDVGAGDCVDIVCPGQDLDFPDNSFDTVVSCECFEHNPFWNETFANMYRMCRLGGLVVISCATTGRPEDGTTRTTPKDSPLTISKGWDYYKNLTQQDFTNAFNIESMFSVFNFSIDTSNFDLYFYGVKK